MHRRRVVDQRADALAAQIRLQRIPPARPDHILVEDVAHAGSCDRRADARIREQPVVFGCQGAAASILRIQIAQLDAQDGRLELIQPAVKAGDGADIALAPAILPQQPSLFRQRRIASSRPRRHRPARRDSSSDRS